MPNIYAVCTLPRTLNNVSIMHEYAVTEKEYGSFTALSAYVSCIERLGQLSDWLRPVNPRIANGARIQEEVG